jgi:hypothetical protein
MNKKFAFAVWLVMAIGSSVAPALAQESLGEKKIWREQEQYLAGEGTDMKDRCGKDIPASFDKPSYKGQLEGGYSVYGYCSELYSALRTICADPDGKAAVNEKIKKLECAFGGKDKRALSLKDGTLKMIIDWEASNYGDFINAWLLKNL